MLPKQVLTQSRPAAGVTEKIYTTTSRNNGCLLPFGFAMGKIQLNLLSALRVTAKS